MQWKQSSEFRLPTGILGGQISADGKTLATACLDGVYISDVPSKHSERIGLHSSYVSSAVLFANDQQLITAGYDGVAQWFDVPSRSKRQDVKLHDFWSWDAAVSPNGRYLASVTGQYLAGGYKYEPQAEQEPSLRLVDAKTRTVVNSFSHVPSVQAVAFSPDSRFVAAGNLMGEVRIWDVESGDEVGRIQTDDFTSWGIIKTHSYIGGIFALAFTPDGTEILLAGMGHMRDPMAGNGRQLWQKWKWQNTPQKTGEIKKDDAGEGLMETLAIHPNQSVFVMGGRLRGGDWNVAAFEIETGKRLATLKTGGRITQASFSGDGKQMALVGSLGQPKKKGPKYDPKDFGIVKMFDLN